jgi:hypothetical protein
MEFLLIENQTFDLYQLFFGDGYTKQVIMLEILP